MMFWRFQGALVALVGSRVLDLYYGSDPNASEFPPTPVATPVASYPQSPVAQPVSPSYQSAPAYQPSLAPQGGGYGGAPATGGGGYSTAGVAGPAGTKTDISDTPFAWMLSIPEVASTLNEWQQGGHTDDWLKGHIMQTQWYRTTSESARNWQQLVDQDPMSAEEKIRQASQTVRDIADQMSGQGILSIDISRDLAWQALANGWSDQFLKDRIADTVGGVINWRGAGQQGLYGQQFNTLAHQYAVPISDPAMNDWVNQAIHGSATPDTFRAYVTNMAKSLYPQLSAGLDQGQTVRQIFDPYAQVAAKELEISPDQIDFTEPKWNKAISSVEPKTGAKVAMSLSQWQTEVRTNPTYGYDRTLGAKKAAADLSTQLLQKFGQVA